jgi:hypothetical protein
MPPARGKQPCIRIFRQDRPNGLHALLRLGEVIQPEFDESLPVRKLAAGGFQQAFHAGKAEGDADGRESASLRHGGLRLQYHGLS